ncbi:hypothetical protein BH20VER3_BH20VER3_00820 [soil metagenome]
MNGTEKKIRNREYTAIKMDRELYELAKRRAASLHQTYSEYVRQLIVRDVEPEKADLA